MKSLFYLILSGLVLTTTGLQAQAAISSLVAVEENGPRGKQLNFVYLSDGFTSAQLQAGDFAAEVDRAVDYLFTREPWSRYRSYCNIYRIEVPSNQSGTDNGEAGGQRDTYFESGFSPTIARLNILSSAGQKKAYSIMNTFVPEYDVPIVIVNDSTYGGSGGPIAVATTNVFGPGLVEHEIGHSFAGLGDEYDDETPGYNLFEWPNTTKQTTLAKIPWKIWIEAGTPLNTPEDDPLYQDKVGHFEGANYHVNDNFRAHDRSIMRVLSAPSIGQVNREGFTLGMYKQVSLINEFSPAALTQTFTAPANLTFSVTPKAVLTAPAITVEWKLNGVTIPGETGNSLFRNTKAFGNGTYTIKAIVRDPTDWVRKTPSALVKEITWTLNLSNQTDPPIINTPLPATRVLALASSLFLDATATGPGQITYQWFKNKVALKPAVTTPTLNLFDVTLADAGTYTVKITNPGHTREHSTVLAVLNPIVPRTVLGKGKTATLAFTASNNLPPVAWKFGAQSISNNTHYANATTKALQIKNLDVGDTGSYFFDCGDYGPSPAISLLVVTTKPDYTGTTPTLPTGSIGSYYDQSFPLPTDPLQTPNSFAATLPKGLKIDPKTGRITGIPTVSSKDQILGDEIIFIVGNEFGKIPVKIRLKIQPLPSGVEGIFNGPVTRGSELGGTLGGRIDLAVLSTGSYSGKLILGTESFTIGGVLSVSGPSATAASGSFIIKPKAGPIEGVRIVFQINNAEDADPTTATVEGGKMGGGISFKAWRNKWLPVTVGEPYEGYYTYGLKLTAADDTNPAIPQGTSVGSFKIGADGKLTLTGKMADGEGVTTACHVGPSGEILIYQALYTTLIKGSVQGVMHVDLGVVGDGSDTLLTSSTMPTWNRPENKVASNRVYPNGFGPVSLEVIGGRYLIPASTAYVMGLGPANGVPVRNARLTFDLLLGNDPLPVNADVDVDVKVGGTTKIVTSPNTKNVTLTITPSTGAFKGSYTTSDPDPRPSPPIRPNVTRKVDFQGFILNDEGTLRARGYFLRDAMPTLSPATTPTTSPKHSGEVLLNAASS